MKKRYPFALFFVGLLVIGFAVKQAIAADQHEVYLPLIARDWPPKCEANPYLIQEHDINPNPPGWDYTTVGSLSGSETYIVFWSKLPGFDTTQYKMRITPEMGFLNIVAGGIEKHWAAGCTEADTSFASEPFQEVDLDWLAQHQLLIDPTICTQPEYLPPHEPIPGEPWNFGGDRQIAVGRNWTNWPEFEQTQWRTIYWPIENNWPLKGGGEVWLFQAGCGKEAQIFFDSLSPLEIRTTDQLDQMSLFAWPPTP